jgi:hypothetical protein
MTGTSRSRTDDACATRGFECSGDPVESSHGSIPSDPMRSELNHQTRRPFMSATPRPLVKFSASLKITALALTLVVLRPQSGLGSGHLSNIPLTTYISDLDANGLASDIASDGLGAYSDNVAGVTSFLTTNVYNGLTWGDWQFDTYNSTRAVNESLDTDDAVQPGDPHYTVTANPPFWGTQGLKAHIEVKCTLVYNDMLTMIAGSSFTCPLINRFNSAGVDYGLSPAFSANHYSETTDVQVVCNTADAGGCNDWFIDPIGSGQAVGRLTTASTSKKPAPPVDDGDFYMRFHIHLTRP